MPELGGLDFKAVAEGEECASESLNQVGLLLSQPSLWGEWLAGHPGRALLFREIFSCLVRLRSETGWTDDQLLERLGCDTKSREELSSLTKEHLERCQGYMLWVEDLVKLQDLQRDKRSIVEEAASFFSAAHRELSRAESAIRKGAFSAYEYLELGEIQRGWEVARAQLSNTGAEPLSATDRNAQHLSPKRLEKLASPDADELLGSRVALRMRIHLADCARCEAAASKAGVAPQEQGAPITA